MAGEPIITLVGNLTADPELKYVNNGTPVASFTVASTPRTLNKQTNQWENGEAMFFRCTAWNAYAENITETLHKGMRVFLTGRFTSRNFQRQDGSQGTSLEIQVDEVGPSLRYATAQVNKTSPTGRPQQQSSQPYQQQNNYAQNATHDPAGNLAHLNPWTQQPAGNDQPPF